MGHQLKYNYNYFNDRYQGIPVEGYTAIVEKMLKGSEVMLSTDYGYTVHHYKLQLVN